ncbi:MAG: peptidoglycan DD-metalloendopeptidase family protein [Aeromonadaceae bacterium]
MSRIAEWDPPIPRQHLYAIIMLAGFSVASITMLPAPNELLASNPISVQHTDLLEDTTALATQAADTEFVTVPDRELVGNELSPVDGLAEDEAPEPQWLDYIVKSDDNLSVIFNTLNLPAKSLHKLLEVDIQNSLIRLSPGQKLSFMIDDKNELQQLAIPLDEKRRILFLRKGDNFASSIEAIDGAELPAASSDSKNDANAKLESNAQEKVQAKPIDAKGNAAAKEATKPARPEARPSRVLKGTINGAFVTSARNAGLTNSQIHKIARLFQGRIDFRRDLKKGDSFRVLFDKPHSKDAQVQAVIFNINGRKLTAFRNVDGKFYDEKASSFTTGTFMRFPIPSVRKVSSSFSPSRRNPVTGRVQPHNGTDFAVRVGTPILATGDGVILKAASHPDLGRYVVIRHDGKYSTVYMHMSKLMVKPGQKIKQGTKIGLSGNTGRSTGPHLHYEFRINNRPVDAMRVDLPVNEGMGGKERRQFLAKVREYKRLFEQG